MGNTNINITASKVVINPHPKRVSTPTACPIPRLKKKITIPIEVMAKGINLNQSLLNRNENRAADDISIAAEKEVPILINHAVSVTFPSLDLYPKRGDNEISLW